MPTDVTTKNVKSGEVYDAILVGNDVIRRVRKMTPHGSENQALAPDPHLASFLTKWVQTANIDLGTPGNPNKYGMKLGGKQQQFKTYPLKHAALVVFAGSGNCQDIATLTYGLCLDAFSPECTVQLVSGWDGGHWYVRVRRVTTSKMGTPTTHMDICVDPWPIFAQCVRTVDHFIGSKGSSVKHARGLRGTPNANVEAQILAMVRNFAMTAESAEVLPLNVPKRKSTPHYNHQFCGKYEDPLGKTVYTVFAYHHDYGGAEDSQPQLGHHFSAMLDRQQRLVLRTCAPGLGVWITS